jgi:hypothetical protein
MIIYYYCYAIILNAFIIYNYCINIIISSYFALLLHDGLVFAQIEDASLRMVVWAASRHFGAQLQYFLDGT